MKSFKCTFMTPEGSHFEGTANSVLAPGAEGQFQVLAGHAHIVAVLKRGLVKIKAESAEQFFVIDFGVLEVDGNRDVLLLADKAIKANSEEDAKQKILELEKV